jgi:hypothetical protein
MIVLPEQRAKKQSATLPKGVADRWISGLQNRLYTACTDSVDCYLPNHNQSAPLRCITSVQFEAI